MSPPTTAPPVFDREHLAVALQLAIVECGAMVFAIGQPASRRTGAQDARPSAAVPDRPAEASPAAKGVAGVDREHLAVALQLAVAGPSADLAAGAPDPAFATGQDGRRRTMQWSAPFAGMPGGPSPLRG